MYKYFTDSLPQFIKAKKIVRWKLLIVFLCSLSSFQCANFLEPMTPKDTNEAYLYSARKKIDKRQYLSAIEDLTLIESDFAADNDVRVTFASAYAGACGMEFIPFFNSISQANITPPSTLFKYLRSSFTDKATVPNYCILSETKLKEIGSTAALREAAMAGKKEANMFMAILAMAKIGSILRSKSDIDGTNSLGDGDTDAGFNSCTNDAANFTDDEVIQIATGFALLIENLPTLFTAANNTTAALDAISVAIGLFCNLNPTTKCVTTDASSIDPADKAEFVDTYRDLLNTDAMGIGSCNNINPDACCP